VVLAIRYYGGYKKLFILDLPIFICATLSVFLFYFYTEYVVIKETISVRNRSTAKPLIYLPFVVAIGIGLCINNTKAVIEAIIKKQTPFNRTPKYNVSDDEEINISTRVKKLFGNVYRSKKLDLVTVIELILAIYMTYAVYFTYKNDLYFSLPLVALFQIGFMYTSVLSIIQMPISVFIKKR
ncbi:MAG TPA: hypothetical protein PLH88_13190, partial [Spirochaetota bacterium]|nr:hypothetical protein [Spirochaetota bacterium]